MGALENSNAMAGNNVTNTSRLLRLPMVLLEGLLSVVAAHSQKSAIAILPTLTHVNQIREMTIGQAGRGYPVRIRGVVTYYNWDTGDLFIQDSTAGIWVDPGQTKLALHQGEFVEVEGLSGVGELAPVIEPLHFRGLGEAPMPNPRRPTSEELASGRWDSQWIEMQGVVRSVAERDGRLVLNVSSGSFECSVFVLNYPSFPTDIVDSQVRIRGVFSGLYDPSSVRFIGFQVLTPSWADVKVLKRPPQPLWSVPTRPIRLFLRLTPEGAFTHRVRVRGVVTLQQLGRSLFIRDSEGALLVNTTQPTPLKVGDLIDAIGYPAIGDYTVIMRDAVFQRVGASPAPDPVVLSPEKLQAGRYNADLVRLSARLLNCTTRPGEVVLELQAGGVTFSAVLNTETNSSPLGPLRAGSLLQLIGVMIVEAHKNHEAEGFEILLRSPADVVVLKLPSWWTARRISSLLVILAGFALWISIWVAVLRRRVKERTETIRATLESTADGILVVNPDGKIVAYNRKFADLWRIPESVLESRDDNAALNFVLSQLKDSEAFLARVRQTYADHDAQTDDVIEFKDGRVFERHSEPQCVQGRNVGRVWGFRDITERKRAEEALAESQALLRSIIDSTSDWIWSVDVKASRLLWFNQSLSEFFLQAFGIRLEKGIPRENLLPTDELRQEFLRFYQRALREGSYTTEYHMVKAQKTLQLSFNVLRRADVVFGVSVFARDITERQRAEEALRESEARLREAEQLAHLGNSAWDVDTDTTIWSQELYRITGRDPQGPAPSHEERAGIYSPESWARLEFAVKRALATGEPYDIEVEVTRPDGTSRWAHARGAAVRNQDGRVIRLHGTLQDVTERKQAEEALRESEERFRSLVENATVGIYRTTPDGRILMANPSLVEMLGYSSFEELASRNLEEEGFGPNYSRGAFRDKIEREQEVRGQEAAWKRQDGSVVFVRESARVVRADDGSVLYYDGVVEDITQFKRAQEALQDSETRFRTLAEEGPLAIRISRDGLSIYTNQKYREMYGYPRADELVGRPLLERWAPESRAVVEERILRRSRGLPLPTNMEGIALRRDGSHFPVHADVTQVNLPDGPAVLTFLSDISERKEAEKRIKESEEKFRKAFMTAADGMYIATLKEGRIIEVNDRFEDVFGYTRSEVIGKTSLELGLYRNAADRQKLIAGITSQGYVRNLELEGRKKDGELVTILLSANMLEESKERFMLGVVRDVTVQKRGEESLVRLRQAVDASGEVVFITDPEGIFTFVNPEFTRLYGYAEGEVLSKVTPRILKSGAQSPKKDSEFWKSLSAKRVVRGQVVNKAKDDRLLTINSSVSPILDEGGNITGFLAIQRDITERKRLEEQFIQAQKMEAVGRLAAGVAHDFNNLLTIINGHSGLMLRQLPADDRARESFGEIKDAGERAAGLTRQLLAFSRQQVRTSSVLNLNTLVGDSLKMLRRLIGEDIELVFNPVSDLSMVFADTGQIEQVLMNLVVNSRDAMPSGGTLSIEISNYQADRTYAAGHYPMNPGTYVMLAVSDTGNGMDAETQSRIFEPFFTTKGPGKGTGLGLATVYGIVKQNNGYIWVYSELGHGTTFKIFLPAVEGAPEPAEVRGTKSGGSETVLLVEDEVKLRSLARRVLETEGYKVLEAPGGMEALLIASQYKDSIHIMVTDVVMPLMSGRELAERLAKARSQIKILYMSGYTDDTIVRHGILESGVAFLQKPFAPELLARKVREVLDA